jgi:hypothetical protein
VSSVSPFSKILIPYLKRGNCFLSYPYKSIILEKGILSNPRQYTIRSFVIFKIEKSKRLHEVEIGKADRSCCGKLVEKQAL